MKKRKLRIKDEEGRELLVSDGNQVALARYIGMDEEMINSVIEFYCELTGEPEDEVRKFLKFEEAQDEFCS